ncbi:uncharacterized protein LOC131060158 [Cryptomeria japonica]|uniref:uncharacterized protein LOC131060158 n=1 Tax=Cryptomeria japonica TaxID=3369 RepID=UPI0027DA9C92|nr:uncharacterized protein LOC131060158 [Cryptomeria japonica]XP_057849263.2 uncharacterized protein LOC131060158 [Cryptomeria japonica]
MGDTYFPEYDPTPYGGGLDLEELYGKPIVPSEKSCYAPSEPASSLADGEEDDKASVISAYGVELPDFEIDKRNSSPKGKQEEKGSAAEPWKPIYPAPEYHLRDSDLVLPFCNCATPNHCTCPYNIFSFNNCQEEEEGAEEEDCIYTHHDPSSPEHVANKVAQWLFSSSYI